MAELILTEDFIESMNHTNEQTFKVWRIFQENELWKDPTFIHILEANNYNPVACSLATYTVSCNGKTCLMNLTQWRQAIRIYKKLRKSQHAPVQEQECAITPQPLSTEDRSPIEDRLIAIEKRLDALEAKFESILPYINRRTVDELKSMRDASLEEFSDLLRFGEIQDKASSRGVRDMHPIHSTTSNSKSADISADGEVTTSIVYDTANPSATKEEVALREAKEAVKRARNKNNNVKKHVETENERNQRWLEAVKKSRIKNNLLITPNEDEGDNVNYDDPGDSIFAKD